MHYIAWYVMLGRLALSALAGAVVGQERERRDHPAGFRTHLLVSAGSCLFTLISVSLAGDTYDPGRVAAGIVTGMGFLGAGTIIRHGASVRGLTTAASLWSVAAVGMASGIGWWQAVAAATLLLYLALTCLHALEDKLFRTKRLLCLSVEVDRGQVSLGRLRAELVTLGQRPETVRVAATEARDGFVIEVDLGEVPSQERDATIEHLAGLAGVKSVQAL